MHTTLSSRISIKPSCDSPVVGMTSQLTGLINLANSLSFMLDSATACKIEAHHLDHASVVALARTSFNEFTPQL